MSDLIASGGNPSLNVGSSEYLSGAIGANPIFNTPQTIGVISGAVTAGLPWIQTSGSSVTVNANTTLVSGNDFYVFPPCSLTVSYTNGYALLYAYKTKSGMSELTTTIDFIVEPNASSASDVLGNAQSQIQGVYVPLAVLNCTSSGVSIEWEIDQNSQYSAPLLNEITTTNSNLNNLQNFASSQWNALSQDTQNVSKWQTDWTKASLTSNFTQIDISQGCSPANTDIYNGAGLPDGIPANTIALNTIRFNPVHCTITVTLRGIQWGPNTVVASQFPNTIGDGWVQIYTQTAGGLEPVLQNLLPNASSLTGTYYYAPNEPLVVPALITTNGTPSNGTSIWQKDVIWYTDGNIYAHFGDTDAQETNFGVPWGGGFPNNFQIYIMDATTNLPVVTQFPATPWSDPTFQSSYNN